MQLGALSTGPHTVAATYNGGVSFNRSTAQVFTQGVNMIGTTVTVKASPNPSVVGEAVTFTATVASAAAGSGTPTGTVEFKDGAASMGSATVDAGGVATISTKTLSAADHVITASYGGDAIFLNSVSSDVKQSVLADSDADGVPDVADACPNDPNKAEPGSCGCGVPDTDADGNGTADCLDAAAAAAAPAAQPDAGEQTEQPVAQIVPSSTCGACGPSMASVASSMVGLFALSRGRRGGRRRGRE